MVNLHVHSMFSLRDSIIKPADLAKRVSEIGQKAVAVTDHGGSLGGVTIYKELKAAGIKYIHGVEFYICDDVKIKDKDSKYYHLVALCKNDIGRLNMNRLITMSEHPDHKYFKPRIDFEMLKQYSEGLIILSACLAGEVSKAILNEEYDRAQQVAQKYKDHFGDDYYIEIQSHTDPEQIKVNQALVSLADYLEIPVVVTTDAHYAYEADRMYQNKYAFNGAYKEDGEAYVDCFLQSEGEVRDRLSYFTPEQISAFIGNTDMISDKCQLEMPLAAPIMPQVDTPEQYPDNEAWLHDICKHGFRKKLNIDYDTGKIFDDEKMLIRSILADDGNEIGTEEYQLSSEQIRTYIERYQYEMNALSKMGFIDYIILVYSYANVGKRRGIARGSGGGSLVNYLSNITNIDPIEHGLYFERFIDVGALSKLESGEITAKELKIPDIDLDFSGESCKEVLRFLFDKYGEDRVASIGRFGTNKTKGTIRDLCKVLDLDLATADQIAKSFEHFEIDDIDSMIRGEIPASASASDAIKYVKHYTELFDFVRKLNGLPKSFGLHPCGRVISVRDLDTFLPSCYDDSGIRFLQGDMHDVEDVGLVKVDVLGLRTLDQEYDTLEMSGQTMEFLDPRQRYTDPKVLDIFRKGDTLGIFQMASPGMKKTLKKMNVSGIEDISVANALFRPGSMQYIDNFCERKAGREAFEYLHPDLEPILRNTYGIIVFQEQLIEIGRLAKLHNPDLLRKATGKKNPKLLAQIKPELEDKLTARGWSSDQFEKLWSDMLDFARYSFNKAHSSAYGIIAYMTAKQKAYYPAEFFAGLYNSYIGESSFVKDDASDIAADMMRHDVRIKKLSFRDDHRACSVENGKIIYAVPLIRDSNLQTAEVLYKFSRSNENFFWRLCRDMMNEGLGKSKLEVLVKLDFFDEFANSKKLLRILDFLDFFKNGERASVKKAQIESSEFLYSIVDKYSTSKNAKGDELKTFKILNCDAILDELETYIKNLPLEDFDFKSKIATQKEYLGFVCITTANEADRSKLMVKGVFPLHRKKDNALFGYSIVSQSMGSGKESRMTVFKRRFEAEPIKEGDLIRCKQWQRDGQYFQMLDYEHLFS